MTRVKEYPTASTYVKTDELVVDGTNGVRTWDVDRFRDAMTIGKGGINEAHFFDQFRTLTAIEWASPVLANGGTATIIGADTAPATVEGVGWLRLLATSTAASQARLSHQTKHIRGGMKPIYRARVKVPAVFADATCRLGFENIGGTPTSAFIETNSSGQWRCTIESEDGGGAQASNVVSPTPVAGGIYTVRIEVEPTVGVRFYVDDTLIATLTQANAIPTSDDIMQPTQQIDRVVNGGSIFIDWVSVIANMV